MTTPELLFYDGICALCNKSVYFLLNHERTSTLLFISLESEAGQLLSESFNLPQDINSVIFVTQKQFLVRSDAVIALAKRVKFPWSLLSLMRFIPKIIRDWSYDWIARTRYRIWGKYDVCPIPEVHQQHRFITTVKRAREILNEINPLWKKQ